MIQAHKPKLTFEEYLTYEDDTDNRYELINGELITLPPESGPNNFIANYLLFTLASSGFIPLMLIRTHMCEIQVPILREGDAANRYPDLVILQPEHILLTASRLTITLDMPPPQLVVEVVSPGRVGRDRDYISKRAQYAARGIPEYWIVDPQEEIVAVLRLESGEYVEVGMFQGEQALVSPTFPQLNLTARQVLGGEF
ncbi:Uma2 family endonuclease [Lyngbya sp. CCAP 1446/10]|uniref:Uma2 family endonuclease n=1 Tax=Lyngbya sp. CCAP 1446/10 TaxID=439293 RepID=UPI0022389C19|nr:Uma2 family endonuclease [Lyngbya sp. CCAP 1446/10]MCW6049314.1 Uma2 family endonuclease [Lyngbya sp. CCAP 1446/10]